MVVTINNSATHPVVTNKDARSESTGSFSSTVDVHAEASPNKHPPTTVSNKDNAQLRFEASLDRCDLAPEEQVLRRAVSSILELDSSRNPKVQNLLATFGGHLVDLGKHLLEGLRRAAPSRLPARVGDYNENLFYEMRDTDQDLWSIIRSGDNDNNYRGELDLLVQRDIQSFEDSIRKSLQCSKVTYRGSFMQTEQTMYQPAHVDFDYPLLQQFGHRLFLAFFPLTDEGAFLQLWQENQAERNSASEEGRVVYIPYGKMLIVPSHTIHGGGFKRGGGGNLRFHLYIEVGIDNNIKGGENEINLLDHPMNKYTERHDRRRELCERFVDASGLDSLLGVFFDV